MFCILDIETIPDERLIMDVFSHDIADTLSVCRAKLDASLPEPKPGRKPFPPIPYHKPIVAVLLVVDEMGMYKTHRVLKDEITIVEEFWELIRQGLQSQFFNHVVTFNGSGFDMPVMELRAMREGKCIPEWVKLGVKTYENPRNGSCSTHVDLFAQFFPFFASKTSSSGLDVIAKMFGLPGKTEHGGSVEDMAKEPFGLNRIAEYCAHDVLNTYGCLLRLLKAADCNVNPWADGAAFESVGHGMMKDVNVQAFMQAAQRNHVLLREKAPF